MSKKTATTIAIPVLAELASGNIELGTEAASDPIPHPAISIEKAAQDETRKWGTKFEVRQ